ncbi:MAG: hypothetical protein JSR54_18915, partial [Proteobacteria bacterium]|nr:hypothetical protein [Pseudomonadota bacterium]
NLTGHRDDDYLADGLQEEILNALARIRDLTVISRTSTAEYRSAARNVREIGTRLGVGSVLEGSVRRDGQTLRLTLQLIDARDDRHLLATNYDRDLGHILGLQTAVAREVAEALAATLSRYERGELDRVGTNNGDAYRSYLHAVALFRQTTDEDEDGLAAPVRLLGEATRLDPDYADAHALLSQAHTWRYFYAQHEEDARGARQAFERALGIDPELPEARLARGLYSLYVTHDADRALADLEPVAALRSNSAAVHSALGYALRRRGRMDEALPHFVRAWDLDPLNHAYDGAPITTLLGLRRYPEAIAQTRLHSARFPDNPEGDEARARLEAFLAGTTAPLAALLRDHADRLPPDDRLGLQAEIARAEGRYAEAARLFAQIPVRRHSVMTHRLAFLHWAAGDAARAATLFREVLALIEREHDVLGEDERAVLKAGTLSMLGDHPAALAAIDAACARMPEATDPVNGPRLSLARSIVLLRAGRADEAYAEVRRLERVPFGAPVDFFQDPDPLLLAVRDDPRYQTLLRHPPRL